MAKPAPLPNSATNGIVESDAKFWDKAFLTAMPYALQCQGWKFGDRPASKGDERMELCAAWADLAVFERRNRFAGESA